MTALTEAATSQQRADDLDTCHVAECHNPDRALCGQDVSGDPWNEQPPEEEECVVCVSLENVVGCGCLCGCCDEDDS